MNRRGFIGSILGMIGSAVIPISIVQETEPDALKCLSLITEFFKTRDIDKCRLFITTETDEDIYISKICKYEIDQENLKSQLTAEPMTMKQSLVIPRCGLIYDNYVIRRATLFRPIHVCDGDSLNITHTFQITL